MGLRIASATRDQLVAELAVRFSAGRLDIRSGSRPASPDDTATGTLLCSIQLPMSAFGPPSSGVVAMAGSWFGTAAASGTAGWCRLRSADGLHRADGSVGLGGGADLQLDALAIAEGGVVVVTAYSLSWPVSA